LRTPIIRMLEYAFLFMDACCAFLIVKSMLGRLEVSPRTQVTASIDLSVDGR